jgi:thymidylate kinase
LWAALDGILRSVRLSFAFVYFDVAVEVALERIQRRPTMKSHFDRIDAAAARRLLTAHKEHLERILAHAVDLTNAPCHRVDASRSLDENYHDVAQFVDQMSGLASGGGLAVPATSAADDGEHS